MVTELANHALEEENKCYRDIEITTIISSYSKKSETLSQVRIIQLRKIQFVME